MQLFKSNKFYFNVCLFFESIFSTRKITAKSLTDLHTYISKAKYALLATFALLCVVFLLGTRSLKAEQTSISKVNSSQFLCLEEEFAKHPIAHYAKSRLRARFNIGSRRRYNEQHARTNNCILHSLKIQFVAKSVFLSVGKLQEVLPRPFYYIHLFRSALF